MGSNYLNYNVDIVFCIDATMSMYKLLDKVKANALNFHRDLTVIMESKGKKVNQLRARVVAFRDYVYDKEKAMLVTDFFNLPQQSLDFANCIKSIVPEGGGDDPEDSLEALAYAIRSDWNTQQDAMNRQVIVLWTDAEPHELGFGRKSEFYPNGMPETINGLSAWWGAPGVPGYMDERGKRLLVYAPECPSWNLITQSWNNSLFYPSVAGDGLNEHEYQAIVHAVAESV